MAQGLLEAALAYFDKVVDIWYKYLSALHNPDSDVDGLLEIQSKPCRRSWRITEEQRGRSAGPDLDTRKQLLGVGHIATGEIEYTGLFEFFLLGHEANAEVFMNSAFHTYKNSLGEAPPRDTSRACWCLSEPSCEEECHYHWPCRWSTRRLRFPVYSCVGNA